MTAIEFFCGVEVFKVYFFVILALEYETVLTHISIEINIFFKWPQLRSVKCFLLY